LINAETENTKACPKCLELKLVTEFYKAKHGRKGRNSYCKMCFNACGRKCRQVKRIKTLSPRDIKLQKLKASANHNKKACSKCLTLKPLTKFSKCKKAKDGHKTWCKMCDQAYCRGEGKAAIRAAVLKKYGLTLETFEEMLASQNHSCQICKSKTPGGSGNFHVDHDHETGVVRGLLCSKCNVALGLFQDDPETLRQAANYLKPHNPEPIEHMLLATVQKLQQNIQLTIPEAAGLSH